MEISCLLEYNCGNVNASFFHPLQRHLTGPGLGTKKIEIHSIHDVLNVPGVGLVLPEEGESG